MSDERKKDFFKAPERLIELLGPQAGTLLTAWFAAAGYLAPKGWNISLFPLLGVIKKKSGAVDADLALDMNYYLTDEEEEPSVNMRASAMLSDEIPGERFPTIEITVKLGDATESFTFQGGVWTVE